MSLTTISTCGKISINKAKKHSNLFNMSLFLSSFINKIDVKGRVSVPAQFRAAVNNDEFAGVVLYRQYAPNCIGGVSMARMEQIANNADTHGTNSKTDALFAEARQMAFDITGRIIIPKDLLKHAGIKDKAIFVGRGNSFQIWNPETFQKTLKLNKEQSNNIC